MSKYNIDFHDKIRKFLKYPIMFFFLELSEEFNRDSKTSSNQPRQTSHRCSNH